jgi:FHS family L-fucose permease-like MFS transporter
MKNQRIVFPAIVTLFFLWAFAHNLNPVLIAKLKSAFTLSDAQSTLVDSAFYIAYFIMSIPAGWMIQKWGYKRVIIIGLLLFSLGTLSFVPAALLNQYSFFLMALMLIGLGITILEAAANPLVTEISLPNERAFKLNLAQSFNGLGAGVAAALGGFLLLGDANEGTEVVIVPFLCLGGFILLLALIFKYLPIPELVNDPDVKSVAGSPWRSSKFQGAVIAQFFYVGAQIGVASFFIRYAQVYHSIGQQDAAYWLSIGLLLFMTGRFVGTALMRKIKSYNLLLIFSIGAMISTLGVVAVNDASIYFLLLVQFFMSIMFPTIFSLGVEPLGTLKAKGSAWIVMTISGGALFPFLMGKVSDQMSLNAAYVIPLFSFWIVALFAFYYNKLKS